MPFTETSRLSRCRRVLRAARVVALVAAVAGAAACTAVIHSAPLSPRPDFSNQVYLSTGGTPRPFRTIGFAQVTGFGNEVAGVISVGDAQVDSTVRGALAEAAVRMGGNGVIHIEFLDENPRTPAEEAQDLGQSLQSTSRGRGEVKTRWRSVHATGEVIQFLQ